GAFYIPNAGLSYPWFAFGAMLFACATTWIGILLHNRTTWALAQDVSGGSKEPRMAKQEFDRRKYHLSGVFIVVVALFYLCFIVPIQCGLLPENRILTYWRAMNVTSGVSPLVPIILFFAGLYLSFWFTLHGLALFGPDRPCLPPLEKLSLKDVPGNFLRM